LQGVDITLAAFSQGLPFGGRIAEIILMVSLAFFAYTTTLGWTFYSEKCLEYLIGVQRRWPVWLLRALFIIAVAAGPYFTVSVVWGIADIFSGLMAFPNLVALIVLSPVVVKCTRDYFGASSH
jgi:AGCS family alanine or glycine:cation symporter